MTGGRHAAGGGEVATGALIAENLSYARAGRTILDDVSLTVAAGETLALVGPSGSGKSSLLALLALLERPDAGSVTAAEGVSGPCATVLQGYGLVSVLTAAENIEVSLQTAGVERSEIAARSRAILKRVGLLAVADHLVEELSGGQQQRVAIARAMVVEPGVVFADELTAELDHEWKESMVELVLSVATRGGIVVLATHDPEVASRCTRTVALLDGRLELPAARHASPASEAGDLHALDPHAHDPHALDPHAHDPHAQWRPTGP